MSKPPGPRMVEVPLKPIDQRNPITFIRTLVCFVVRDILDQELLRTSLDKLIRDHIPLLGGRIKHASRKGELDQYQYPETFPDDATLFRWSNRDVNTTLEEPGLIPDVFSSDGAITWGKPVTDLEAAWVPTDWPLDFSDDGPDTPLLLVHLTAYRNATVLSLSIPHCVADQKGLASMIEAWLLVAQGRQPPSFIQLEPGALDGPPDLPMSDLRRKGQYRVKTKSEYIRSVMGLLPDLIKNREEDRRLLFVSSAAVSGLRDRCNESSKAKFGPDHVELTNGDIVTCILAKLANLDKKKPKYLALGETVNARGRHALLPADGHYLHNCPAYACARMMYSRDTPLAEMARLHRLAVAETATPSGIERSFAVTTKVFHGAYAMPIGQPGDRPYHVTNWSSAWRSLDFSRVVVQKDKGEKDPAADGTLEKSKEAEAGRSPLLVFGYAVQRKHKILRLHAPVLCKGDGGYWADFSCSAKNMALVDELLRRDPRLETL